MPSYTVQCAPRSHALRNFCSDTLDAAIKCHDVNTLWCVFLFQGLGYISLVHRTPYIVHCVFKLAAMLEQRGSAPHDLLEEFLRSPHGDNLDESIHKTLMELIRGEVSGTGRHEHPIIVLFDGLDEGGRYKEHIEEYIEKLAGFRHVHVILSSRETGFNHTAFGRAIFKIFEVLPMTSDMKREVIHKRLNDAPASAGRSPSELGREHCAGGGGVAGALRERKGFRAENADRRRAEHG